jgi:hypothetical protein
MTVAAIVAAMIAVAQLQFWDWLTGKHIPLFPPQSAYEWLSWGLIAACFIAAVFVSVDERQAETGALKYEHDRAEWHDQQQRMLNDPRVQEGFKILQQINDRRAATRNAATRRASTQAAD